MRGDAVNQPDVKFWDAWLRKYVYIPREAVRKCYLYTPKGERRYAIQGDTADGRTLTKYVPSYVWETFDKGKEAQS